MWRLMSGNIYVLRQIYKVFTYLYPRDYLRKKQLTRRALNVTSNQYETRIAVIMSKYVLVSR